MDETAGIIIVFALIVLLPIHGFLFLGIQYNRQRMERLRKIIQLQLAQQGRPRWRK